MPVQPCTVNGEAGWRCGQAGKCYPGGLEAKKKAIAQCIAMGEDPGSHSGRVVRRVTGRRISVLPARGDIQEPSGNGGVAVISPVNALLAYSEDQPRDEHGRWTSGGSSGPINGSTLKEVQKQFSERFQGKPFFFATSDAGGEMSVEAANAVANSFVRNAEAFPNVAGDDHGRWTSGGGAGDAPDFKSMGSVGDIDHALQDRYTNTYFNLRGDSGLDGETDLRSAQQIATAYTRMADKFPDVAARITDVTVGHVGDGYAAWHQPSAGSIAGEAAGDSTSTITFSETFLQQPYELENLIEGSRADEGWWPNTFFTSPDGTIGAITTHEFGHAVQMVRYPGLDQWSDLNALGVEHRVAEYSMGSPRETFADAFEVAQDGPLTNWEGITPETQAEVTRFMDTVNANGGMTGAALLAYSEDQPRDERGRWTTGGTSELTPREQGAAYFKQTFGDNLHIVGDPNSGNVATHLGDLGQLPQPLVNQLADSGLQVYVGDGRTSVFDMDSMQEARSQLPYGQESDVLGVYRRDTNELVIAHTAFPEDNTSTALHEMGHAVERNYLSESDMMYVEGYHAGLWSDLSPYEQGAYPGSPRGAGEMWGEAFATRFRFENGEEAVAERYGDGFATWVEGKLGDIGAFG